MKSYQSDRSSAVSKGRNLFIKEKKKAFHVIPISLTNFPSLLYYEKENDGRDKMVINRICIFSTSKRRLIYQTFWRCYDFCSKYTVVLCIAERLVQLTEANMSIKSKSLS